MICDSNLHNLHKAEENQTLSYDRNSSDGETSLKRQKLQKLQQTHMMSVSIIDFTCKMFIFWNIYRCKSTKFCFQYYSLPGVEAE